MSLVNTMRSKWAARRVLLFAIIVAGASCLFVCLIVVDEIQCRARLNAAESGQLALFFEVRTQLALYRRNHGSFPHDLASLHLVDFPDGATPGMLSKFDYASDGVQYTLNFHGVSSRELIAGSSSPEP